MKSMRVCLALSVFGAIVFGPLASAQAQEDLPDFIAKNQKGMVPHLLWFDSFQQDKVAGETSTFSYDIGEEGYNQHTYTFMEYGYENEVILIFEDDADANEDDQPEENIAQLDLSFGVYVYGAALKRSEDGLQFVVEYGSFIPEKIKRKDDGAKAVTKNYAGVRLQVYDDNGDTPGVLDSNDHLLDTSRFLFYRDCKVKFKVKGEARTMQPLRPMNQGLIETLKVQLDCDESIFESEDLWFGTGNDFRERIQEKFNGGVEVKLEDEDGPRACTFAADDFCTMFD